VLDYLRLCSGVRQFLPGTLKLRGKSGEELEVRCEGAALDGPHSSARHILLRVKPKQVAVDRFQWLNRQIDLLNQRIGERKQVETELRAAQEALRGANSLLADKADHLETLVRQRTARLEESVGELESFSYSVAHDLRAPLRSLQGFSDILLSDYGEKLDDEGRRFLHRIVRSAGRMDQLIRDVLSYSQVVSADLPLEKVDIEQLLLGIIDTYPMLAPDQAEVVLQGPFPPVLGNQAVLTQIFSNLMGNGVKFVAPDVKPRLKVWAETRGENVRFFVRDNGLGIAADQHERIFQIFQRLDKVSEGTGIGLAIVKKAVERLGGRVGLESEPDRGSTFWIEVPSAPQS
jgi:signal transduction histidine kinase